MQIFPWTYWKCKIDKCGRIHTSYHKKTIMAWCFLLILLGIELLTRNWLGDLRFYYDNWDNWDMLIQGIMDEIWKVFEWWVDEWESSELFRR